MEASTSGSGVLPATTMLVFDNPLSAAAVGGKIRSLSAGLASAPDTVSMALTDAESAGGGALDCLLSRFAHKEDYSSPGLPKRMIMLQFALPGLLELMGGGGGSSRPGIRSSHCLNGPHGGTALC